MLYPLLAIALLMLYPYSLLAFVFFHGARTLQLLRSPSSSSSIFLESSMLKKLHAAGNRVLVFSQMTALLDILQVSLPSYFRPFPCFPDAGAQAVLLSTHSQGVSRMIPLGERPPTLSKGHCVKCAIADFVPPCRT